MTKTKSVCVTSLVMLMLAVIMLAAYRLAMPVFVALTAVFASVGVVSSGVWFCHWLEWKPENDDELPPPEIWENEKEEEA